MFNFLTTSFVVLSDLDTACKLHGVATLLVQPNFLQSYHLLWNSELFVKKESLESRSRDFISKCPYRLSTSNKLLKRNPLQHAFCTVARLYSHRLHVVHETMLLTHDATVNYDLGNMLWSHWYKETIRADDNHKYISSSPHNKPSLNFVSYQRGKMWLMFYKRIKWTVFEKKIAFYVIFHTMAESELKDGAQVLHWS